MSLSKLVMFFFVSFAMVLLLLSQCDKDQSPSSSVNNDLIGGWTLTQLTIITDETTIITEAQLNQMGAYWILHLNVDQSFLSDYNIEAEETETGTWNASGKKLTVTFQSGGSMSFDYSIEASDLVLEWTEDDAGTEENLIARFKKIAGIVTDIDGNTYRTAKIGDQWWMAENLKVTHYRNGDDIPNVPDNNTWINLNSGALCSFENDDSHITSYGLLYNWYAAADNRNIAPKGWHVATHAEWITLVDYLGGEEVAGGKMKATGTTLWNDPNTGATNESGFSAIPGGIRYYDSGNFGFIGHTAYYWSSTESDRENGWLLRLRHYNGNVVLTNGHKKQAGFSVRCIKD